MCTVLLAQCQYHSANCWYAVLAQIAICRKIRVCVLFFGLKFVSVLFFTLFPSLVFSYVTSGWMQIVGWVVSCVVSCQGKHPVAVTRATRSASGISIFNSKLYFPVSLFCICILLLSRQTSSGSDKGNSLWFRDFYFKNWISCWIYFIIFGKLIPGFLFQTLFLAGYFFWIFCDKLYSCVSVY